MPRLAPLDPAQLSEDERRIMEAIAKSRSSTGIVGGPFAAWMRSPELCDRAQHLGDFCRFHSSLEPVHSEFAIIVTAQFWKSQYEFFAHAKIALSSGVPEAVVEAIRTGKQPTLTDPKHVAIYAFVKEYFETHRVSDATYAQAKAALTERGVVDLVGIIGYYTLVAMTLNVFEVSLPEGEPDPLP